MLENLALYSMLRGFIMPDSLVVWFMNEFATSWTKVWGSWSLFLCMLSQQEGVVFLRLKEFSGDLLLKVWDFPLSFMNLDLIGITLEWKFILKRLASARNGVTSLVPFFYIFLHISTYSVYMCVSFILRLWERSYMYVHVLPFWKASE